MKNLEDCKKDMEAAMEEFIDAFVYDCGKYISVPGLSEIEAWLRDHSYNFAIKTVAAAIGRGFTPDTPL